MTRLLLVLGLAMALSGCAVVPLYGLATAMAEGGSHIAHASATEEAPQ